MRQAIFLSSILVLFLFTASYAQQEQITITTYYPSPFGSYRDLNVTNSLSVGPFSTYTTSGYVSVTGADGGLSLARRDLASWPAAPLAGDSFVWYNPAGSLRLWTPVNFDLVTVLSNGAVGLGTTNPGARLEVGASGDILLKAGAGDPGDIIFQESNGNQKARIWSEPTPGYFRLHLSSADSSPDITIHESGRVGIGTTDPTQRLQVMGNMVLAGSCIGDDGHIIHHNGTGNMYVGRTSGGNCGWPAGWAYLSSGGVWTDQSSRASKDNIRDLSEDEAIAAVMKLQPVKFNYKNHNGEEYVGFIAEDVPDLVASEDRKGLSPMDIVAVLTKVVQQQQKEIKGLKAQLNERAAKTGSELF